MLSLADFDFHLPEDRIAIHPASPRDSSRLLVVRGQALEDRIFRALPDLLNAGDLLVFNDTKVIPARLHGTRTREIASQVVAGSREAISNKKQSIENTLAFEALLVKRLSEDTWQAFAKPGKRLKPGDIANFGTKNPACDAGHLRAEVTAKNEEGLVSFRFERAGASLDEAIALVGAMPLPPYILEARKRLGEGDVPADARDYQTIFAAKDGAVAAPTASLHFTPEVLAGLAARGVEHAFVTLHVGAGTFLPVKVENLDAHKMHAEWGEVSPETAAKIRATRAAGGRVVAVGTTACRLIESCAHLGQAEPWVGETDIFIRPGYRFRTTDALITNFHLPKSTLLMLVSAFAGVETMRAAYAHAIASGYRFYSYGDGSLLFPDCLGKI
jgi:S-adenosylmethionine:tRNA ribosyltransferase-isomerase